MAGAGVLVALALLLAVPTVRHTVMNLLGLDGLPDQKHLVVLPMADLAEEAPDAAFTDGLVETMVSSLRQLEQSDDALWVVPTEKVREFSVENAGDARSAFSANLALAVGVERKGQEVQVLMNLIDAEEERLLASATVTKAADEMAALRGDLVLTLADLLNVDLAPPDHRALTAGGTATPGAYEFYTQGLGYLQRYTEERNIDAAVQLFERALERDSTFALAYAGLGRAYRQKFVHTQDIQWALQAERYCERAIELDDQLATVYVTLGLVHNGTGRYGTAIAEFRLALAGDPANGEAMRGLAKAYESLGRLEEAEAAYRQAIATKPDYWEGYNDLGLFYMGQARYEDARSTFEQVTALAPLNHYGYINLGAAYWYMERNQEAIAVFEQALSIKPDAYRIYSNLATLYFFEGQFKEVAQTYERALQIQDTDYRVWGYLATAYENSGEPEKARQANERAARMAEDQLTLNPRNPEVMAHLAAYYAAIGEREKALSRLEQLIAENPTDPEDFSTIANTYEELGERELALAWYEKAFEKGFSLAEVMDNPELEDLHADPRFQELLARYRGDAP